MTARITVLSTLLAAAMALSASAQGLGDAAAREKQHRAEADDGVSGRMITEDDLEKYESERPEPMDEPSEEAESERKSGTPALIPVLASRRSVDEDAARRAGAEEYKKLLIVAEARLEAAEEELSRADEHWGFVNSHTNDSFPLSEARSRLEGAQKAVKAARMYRDDILDAARRDRIPPGWLR